ncbi:hypothetical protein ACFL1B_03890, partial [Nanoarchaeota archaeon]
NADRHYFISEPVPITIKGAPKQKIDLHLHPEHRRGGRLFQTHENFFLAMDDLEALKEGEIYRLMECL